MLQLTEQQKLELRKGNNVRVSDPDTHEEFVVVRADVFERIKSLLQDDWSEDAYRAALEVFARDGWDDPRMDVYDHLDPRRSQ